MKFNRILLKLSGESLGGNQGIGFDANRLEMYAREIMQAHQAGVQVAIVLGGGNIFRGLKGNMLPDRVQGDYMGMLATVINSLALQTTLNSLGVESKVYSGIAVDPVAERMSAHRALETLRQGKVAILGGGTGNPFFTTDTAAALRAVEIQADVLLKGTRVDGVYTADPEKDPSAVKYDQLTFDEAYSKGLNIMDLTAFTLCSENKLPVVVYNANVAGNLMKILSGERCGTLVEG